MLKEGVLSGALAGLVGGLVFGAAMWQLDMLASVAALVRVDSAIIGFILHMMIAAIIGAGFGLLVWQQRCHAGETLLWGLSYGIVWWVLGPLALAPLLRGQPLGWEVAAAQAAFPALLGHIWYGAATGLALAAIRRQKGETATSVSDQGRRSVQAASPQPNSLWRGAIAGLLAAWLLSALLGSQAQLMDMVLMMTSDSHTLAVTITLFVGLLAGWLFAWLYPSPTDGSGVSIIRGLVYGFFWWVAGGQTLLPLLNGNGLSWTLPHLLEDFPTLPGYLLFGAMLSRLYQWLHQLTSLLFSDAGQNQREEGVGTRGLRALGCGTAAGLVGSLLFTVVMLQIGFLPTVASLIGSGSIWAGFILHMVFATLIGMSYGLLFNHQSYDLGSALGWGVSYGFFWWLLGPLTLMPLLLGQNLQWDAATIVSTFAALIGHLAYGAALAITFYWLEARDKPWWVSEHDAEVNRIAQRKAQIATSAPALWVLVVMIALIFPVLLGMAT
ncbi:hypothetical protein MNBD_CHLOROFLEXI01-3382 [hydrothermal vent metagenome]|uniref:Uncharacterized protein n=1 Tax=hydrothermal vent metagenome TaxID=652676 RepID=A0A3B0VUM7_9ZZZZ